MKRLRNKEQAYSLDLIGNNQIRVWYHVGEYHEVKKEVVKDAKKEVLDWSYYPAKCVIVQDEALYNLCLAEGKHLEAHQAVVKEKIKAYDSSDSVNMFYVSGQPIWLDKATRAGLLLRFQAEQAQGLANTTLWYDGMQFPLLVEDAIKMLYAIELYASACYDNTQRHYSVVNSLTTVEDLEAYDHTTGYPEKLRF